MTADDLYGLDPSDFVAARNQLAKEMRAGGDKEGAASVARLRRPPATAWALNQLARRHPEVVGAALDGGARLRSATERALEGDASDLRSAQADERAAVEAAVTAAAHLLEGAGHAGGDRPRQVMAGTLRAASADEGIAERLRAGALDADREPSGLGLEGLSPSAVIAPPARTEQPSKVRAPTRPPHAPAAKSRLQEKEEQREHRKAARARHAQLVADADRLEREARHLRSAAGAAERRAADARVAAEAAEQRAAHARAVVDADADE